MNRASMLRSVLGLLASHHGRAAIQRAAEWYEAAVSESEPPMIQSICRKLDGSLDRFVLEEALTSLESWNELLAVVFGAPPVSNHEEVLAALVERLDAEQPQEDDGLELDEDSSEYPGCETLVTDGELPWVRTALADFQAKAVRKLDTALGPEGRRAALLVLPEGAGMVRTALDHVVRSWLSSGARVLWIGTHRELLDHVHEELRELAWLAGECGLRRGELTVSRYGSQHTDLTGDLILASAQALSRDNIGLGDVERAGALGLICLEDARLVAHPRARQTIEWLWGSHVSLLGLSGRPAGTGAAGDAIREVFGPQPAYEQTFREIVERKFLGRPVFVRRRIASAGQTRIGTEDVCRLVGMRQDLRSTVLQSIAAQPGRNQQIVGHWINHKERYGRTMVFAAGRQHADTLAADLLARGVAAESVHAGLDPGVRIQREARYRKGDCQVLVRAGLLTEGEQIPETQTVMLARPTTSASLYLRMISAASRRAAGPLSSTHFFVVDFVDGLERQGVQLAGREAAAALGAEFQDTHSIVLPLDTQRRRQRRDRALISARAWQVLQRFAGDQYSVWGELVWALPRGGEKSVVVFNEGVARLRAAVDKVEQTLPEGGIGALRPIGAELDFLGAVRDVDWQEMLSDCAQTELAPRLERVEGLSAQGHTDACAQVLAELVSDVVAGRIPIPSALARADAMLESHEALKEYFQDPLSLRQEVMKLYNDAISRIEQAAPASETGPGRTARDETIDAFIRFAVDVAMADNVLLDEEARAIEKAVSRMFDLTEPEQVQWIYQAMDHYRRNPTEPDDAAKCLAECASHAEILHMYDWLFRVAFADGVFVHEERKFLKDVAARLGISTQQFHELADRYTAALFEASPVSVSVPLMPRLRYCTNCAHPRQSGARYCVACGAGLRGGAEATS